MTSTACIARTRSGRPCLAYALAGSKYCFTHDPARAAQRAAAHSAGGRARHGRTIGPAQPAGQVRIKTVADVTKVLAGEVNAVLTLEVSLSRGQTIARLGAVLIKCFEIGEIEQRIEALEASIANGQ